MKPLSTYARNPRLIAALAALAFVGSLLYAARGVQRIRRARSMLEAAEIQRTALAPLQRRWSRYRRTESLLPRRDQPVAMPLAPDLPRPVVSEKNQVQVKDGWVVTQWRAEWPAFDYAALPRLLEGFTHTDPGWRIRELQIEPAGAEPGSGRLIVEAETLTPP